MPALRVSEWIAIAYFAYLAAISWLMPLPMRRRLTACSVSAGVTIAIVLLSRSPTMAAANVRQWVPAACILAGYWMSGAFFRQPMPNVERVLQAGDRWLYDELGVSARVDASPRWLLEICELAYASVTPLVPLGFLVLILAVPFPDADRFWSPVVASELACYAVLPWIQSRPPRALGDHVGIDRRRLVFRRLNARILASASIRVNTVPSGHAAGAVAVGLAVTAQAPAEGMVFLAVAIAICVGALIGRYHYLIDVLTGIAVAIAAFVLFGRA